MSKVISIQKNQTSSELVPVTAPGSSFSKTHFFAAYGDKTNTIMVSLLDKFYRQYRQSEQYQYLSFGDKVDVEFKFEVLRRFIQSLKR